MGGKGTKMESSPLIAATSYFRYLGVPGWNQIPRTKSQNTFKSLELPCLSKTEGTQTPQKNLGTTGKYPIDSHFIKLSSLLLLFTFWNMVVT